MQTARRRPTRWRFYSETSSGPDEPKSKSFPLHTHAGRQARKNQYTKKNGAGYGNRIIIVLKGLKSSVKIYYNHVSVIFYRNNNRYLCKNTNQCVYASNTIRTSTDQADTRITSTLHAWYCLNIWLNMSPTIVSSRIRDVNGAASI